MPFTDPRGLPIADAGTTVTALCSCTLADYSSGGTQTPLVGDIVTFSFTTDWSVKRCPNAQAVAMGRVTRIEVAPTGSSTGYVGVEFLDVERFVALNVTNLANVTRGQRMVKNGADTVAEDWVSQASGSQWLVVAKSAASSAGQAVCAILA